MTSIRSWKIDYGNRLQKYGLGYFAVWGVVECTSFFDGKGSDLSLKRPL